MDTVRRSTAAQAKVEADAEFWRYDPTAKPEQESFLSRKKQEAAETAEPTGRTAEKTEPSETGDGRLPRDHARASKMVMDSLADLKVRLKNMREDAPKVRTTPTS